MGDAAEDHPEGGRGFALTLAGVNDDQALFIGLGRHDFIAGGLFLGHLHRVAFVIIGHGRLLLWLASFIV